MEDSGYFLYHYTNIESLVLILANRTIRFTSLDQMDDLQEKETSDLKNAGRYCYVSSWTEEAIENIPMWNMYSSLEAGVRIKLKKNPFKIYENTPDSIEAVTNQSITDNSDGNYFKSFIPVSEMMSKGFICPDGLKTDILHKVEYTSDEEKLYPKLVETNGSETSVAFGDLGKYKNLHWAFQNEWRYILLFMPLQINQTPERILSDANKMVENLLKGKEQQLFPYYDLSIDDIAFSQMEITLSPRISFSNRLLVETIVEKYNPTAELLDSSLLGLL